MVLKPSFFLAALLMGIFGFAKVTSAQEVQSVPVSVRHLNGYFVLGKSYGFSLDESQVPASPRWARPYAEPPPLAVKKAIGIAQVALRKYVDDPNKWHLSQIVLRSIGKQPRWYYIIEWYPSWDGYMGDGLGIPVLMTGKAVELVQAPESPDPER